MKMLAFFSMMLIFSAHPMMMIVGIIMMILLYSYMMYLEMNVFWFSYLLVLVMMSGVMVVFTYMMSLLPNESFEITSSLVMGVLLFFMYSVDSGFWVEDKSMVGVMLWELSLGLLNVFMVMFLFVVMLISVWLSNKNDGAVSV